MLTPIDIAFSSLNISTLIPMAISVCGALLILIIDFCSKQSLLQTFKSFYAAICVLFLAGNILYLYYDKDLFSMAQYGFFDFILSDGIALLGHQIILVGALLFVILTLTNRHFHDLAYAEFYALFLFIVGGLQFMVSSDNLILIFLGLETSSLALYTLIAMHNRHSSLEAAIKYFSMGAVAAGLFCFGAMLLYFATGEFQLAQISQRIGQSQIVSEFILLVGVVFIFAALAFKMALVPFHVWTPDVYEGASSLTAGFLSIVPKVGAFVVMLRFFDVFLESQYIWIKDLMYVIAVVSITLPNLIALLQEDVKRMLAYSSISHAGLALVAIMIHTPQATQALFLYWSLFLVTNLGAFGILWLMQNKANLCHHRYDHPYTKFSGLIQVMPLEAILMAIFILSLTGIPPFALFWGKMYLISASLNSGFIVLALIIAINSVIASYYYLKLIVFMFLKEKTDALSRDSFFKNATMPLKIVLVFAALMVSCSIFYIEKLLECIKPYIG